MNPLNAAVAAATDPNDVFVKHDDAARVIGLTRKSVRSWILRFNASHGADVRVRRLHGRVHLGDMKAAAKIKARERDARSASK